MNNQPRKITILRPEPCRNWFTLLCSDWKDDVTIEESLTFDELLGTLARILCPTMDDGTPCRHVGKPLFLSPPIPVHPDANGDAAP